MKDIDKIEKEISNYFKLVNPLPYDEVKIDFERNLNLFLITIYVKDYSQETDYFKGYGNEMCIRDMIVEDMRLMFPYNFKLYIMSYQEREEHKIKVELQDMFHKHIFKVVIESEQK
jgi:hypothetical protein